MKNFEFSAKTCPKDIYIFISDVWSKSTPNQLGLIFLFKS